MQVDPFGQNINKAHVTRHTPLSHDPRHRSSPRVISLTLLIFLLLSYSFSNAGDVCESNMTARAAPVQISPGKGLGFISESLLFMICGWGSS